MGHLTPGLLWDAGTQASGQASHPQGLICVEMITKESFVFDSLLTSSRVKSLLRRKVENLI